MDVVGRENVLRFIDWRALDYNGKIPPADFYETLDRGKLSVLVPRPTPEDLQAYSPATIIADGGLSSFSPVSEYRIKRDGELLAVKFLVKKSMPNYRAGDLISMCRFAVKLE